MKKVFSATILLCLLAIAGTTQAQQPTVTGMMPMVAIPGATVTITGTDFNPTPANNIVYFGATRATVNTASATSLSVTVPAGATYAPVSVLNTAVGLVGSAQYPFLPTWDATASNTSTIKFNAHINMYAGSQPNEMVVGDVDGDGKPDIVSANLGSNSIYIHRNVNLPDYPLSSSSFTFATVHACTAPNSVNLCDLNGDGKPEILTTNNTSPELFIFSNSTTSGTIDTNTIVLTATLATNGIAIQVTTADIDGDGRLDIITSNPSTNTISVFRCIASASPVIPSSFSTRVDIPYGSGTQGKFCVGDADNDGKPDIVVISSSSNIVSVIKNNATPGTITTASFATRVDYSVGVLPICVATADLDNDGKQDIITGSLSNRVSVFKNQSTTGIINSSSFPTKVDFLTGGNNISIGDLNGDSKPDIAIISESSNLLSILINTGSTPTISSTSFSITTKFVASQQKSVAICDLDGDTKPDIAIANQAGSGVSGGPGRITLMRNMPLPLTLPSLPPVITNISPAKAIPGNIITITGSGLDSFSSGSFVHFGPVKAPVTSSSATSVSIAAPVFSGYAPVRLSKPGSYATSRSSKYFLPTYNNSGFRNDTCIFQPQVSFSLGPNDASNQRNTTRVADFDGDGKPDVATLNKNNSTVCVFRNTTASIGAFSTTSLSARIDLPAYRTPGIIGVADFNNDGKTDIAVLERGSGGITDTIRRISIYINNSTTGSISFYPKVDVDGIVNSTDMTIDDVDGDGKSDIVMVGWTGSYPRQQLCILRNSYSSGTFNSASFCERLVTGSQYDARCVVIADVDRDGKKDLIVGDRFLNIYKNISTPGNVQVADPVSFTTDTVGVSIEEIKVADFDGDNKPDIVTSSVIIGSGAPPNPLSILKNISDSGIINISSLAPYIKLPKTIYYRNNIEIADINGDSKPDVVTSTGSSYFDVFLNNSSGTIDTNLLSAAIRFSASTGTVVGIQVNDMDGDNIPDVVTKTTEGLVLRRNFPLLDIVITGDSSICRGSTSTLTASVTGGTWTSSSPSIATVGSSTGIVSGVAAGTAIITYLHSGSGKTMVITINPSSVASIGGTTTVCVTGTTTLTNTTLGGTWSSSNTTIATVGSTGIVTGIASGTVVISYSTMSGCVSDVVTKVITVNALPNAGTITGTATVCTGSTTTLSNTTPGGIWSSSNVEIATVSSLGVVTGTAIGSTVISYTVTNGCGSNTATRIVIVGAAPVAGSISGTATLCAGTTTTLTGTVGGGVWVSANTTIATVSSTGVVTGHNAGETLISYVVSGSCGSSAATQTVTVNAPPYAGSVLGESVLCVGSSTTLSATLSGGTWSSSAPSIATVDELGNVTGISGGSAVIAYGGFTNECGTSYTPLYITIDTVTPAQPITGTTALCAGTWGTLANATPGGTWTSSNTDVATVGSVGDVMGYALGTTTISYTLINSCGSNTATTVVTINTLPDAGSIYGSSILCAGTTTPLSISVEGGTWSSSNTDIASVDSNGLVTGYSAGEVLISYTVSNECGSSVATLLVTVSNIPYAGTIYSSSGDSSMCIVWGSYMYLYNSIGGGNWTSANPDVANIDEYGNVTAVTSGTTTITYGPISNECGISYATLHFTVDTTLSLPPISGTNTMCIGGSTSLANAVSGGTWSSANTSIATVSSSGVVTGMATGTTAITYGLNNSCGYFFSSTPVIVHPFVAPITGNSWQVCTGQSIALGNTVDGCVWSSANPTIATVSGAGIVTGQTAGTAVISYQYSGSCGTALSTATITVNQNVAIEPSSMPVVITGDTSTAFTYGASSGLQYSLIWNTEAKNKGFRSTPFTTTTIAGNGGYGGDGGPATAATLNWPTDVVRDAAGNVYIAGDYVVRKVAADGTITTVAGNNALGSSTYSGPNGNGGPATAARINPRSIAVDATGNLYIGDYSAGQVRKVDASGTITVVAGAGSTYIGSYAGDGGAATAVNLNYSIGDIAIDGIGNMYIADGNNRVRKVNSSGIITTVAGNGSSGAYSGDGIAATATPLGATVRSIAVDASNNLFILGSNEVVRKVTPAGIITTYAGTASGTTTTSYTGGVPATAARFDGSSNIAADASGNIFLSERARVLKISTTGIVTNIVGSTNTGAGVNGDGSPATATLIVYPGGVAAGPAGELYIADNQNGVVRKVTTAGIVETFAGNRWALLGDGGPATATAIQNPYDIKVNHKGEILFIDGGNYRIRKVNNAGIMSTVAGNGTAGSTGDGGPATAASLRYPGAIAVDAHGNTFVAGNDGTIRKIDTNGIINSFASISPYSSNVYHMTFDKNGNMYAAGGGSYVLKIDASGYVSVVAGNGSSEHNGDGGPATNAGIYNVIGLTTDDAGNIYLAGGGRIRKINPAGIITTIAGPGPESSYTNGDGGPATAATINANKIEMDAFGNLLLLEYNTIRKISPDGVISTLTPYLNTGTSYNTMTLTKDGKILLGGGSSYVNTGKIDKLNSFSPLPASPMTTYVPQDATPGIYRGELTISNGLCQIPYAASVTVLGKINGASAVCVGSSSLQTHGTPGGVWSSSNTSVAIIGTSGLVSALTSGSTTITYAVAVNGATRYIAKTITVLDIPSVTLGSTPIVMIGNSPAQLSYTSAFNSPEYSIAWNTPEQLLGFANTADSISTFAGTGVAGYSGDGGPANTAKLNIPSGVVTDNAGNLYIADRNNYVVRKVSTTGEITTVAGNGMWGNSGDGGPATAATLSSVTGIAIDATGNILIADNGNYVIRKITPEGIISTIAGNGTYEHSGDYGAATAAGISYPSSVAADGLGNIYITTSGSSGSYLRKITPDGIISTIAGNGIWGYSGDGGPAIDASSGTLMGVTTDATGNIYVADNGNNLIRKIDPSGIVTTVAGSTTASYYGDGGPATATYLYSPAGIALDASGSIYITEQYYGTVRKISTTGIVSTVATGGSSYVAVAVDNNGAIFAADENAHVVRKIGTSITLPASPVEIPVPTAVGQGVYSGLFTVHNGHCTTSYPLHVAVSDIILGSGNICVGSSTLFTHSAPGGTWSSSNTEVATISSTGMVTGNTSGTAVISYHIHTGVVSYYVTKDVTVTNVPTFTPGTMPVAISGDTATALAYAGVTDVAGYSLVWNDTATEAGFSGTPNIITTIAGNNSLGATYSGDGGMATDAGMYNPTDVAVDANGNLYIADNGNNVIRKISPSGIISTVAGNGSWGYYGDGNAATSTGLSSPVGVAVDATGNLYIAEYSYNTIRKVSPSGIISTVAGNGGWGYSGDGGPATAATLYAPSGIAVDADGNLYIADQQNYVIRKVSPSGIISTVAGSGAYGYSGDDGPATAASIGYPNKVTLDAVGNLYFSDNSNNVIRRVSPSGIISTVAGNGSYGYSGDGGPATNANMAGPVGIATDANGNLFISEQSNNIIRKVAPNGIISTVAGSSSFAGIFYGDNGPATAASFYNPSGIATDAVGNLFIADQNNYVIRKVSSIAALPSSPLSIPVPESATMGTYHGNITLHNGHCTNTYPISVTVLGAIAGNAQLCTGSSQTFTHTVAGGTWSSSNSEVATVSSTGVVTGNAAGTSIISYNITIDGIARYATKVVTVTGTPTFYPGSMPVVATGDTIAALTYTDIADVAGYSLTWDDTAISTGFVGSIPTITTIAGNNALGASYSGDGGMATGAGLSYPQRVAVDATGNLFVADYNNNVVRKVSPSGIISTVAGNGSYGYWGDGGPATAAALTNPSGIAADASGNLYIADNSYSVIRKVSTSGIISTVAGNGSHGYSGDGGAATAASLNYPYGLAVDASGNLFITDNNNHVIRKVTTSGIISTVAGNGSMGYYGDDGPATSAALSYPQDVTVDATGNLFIADYNNGVVRKVSSSGIISTVAGNNALVGSYNGDGGLATEAGMNGVASITLDAIGNLFIADAGNNVIRKVAPSGIINTIVGTGSYGYYGDGGAATTADLALPIGIDIDAVGNLYFADANNNVIRKVSSIAALPPSPLSIPVPESASMGTYHGNITLYNGHCNNTYPISVTVVTPISGTAEFCVETSEMLSNFTPGGSWSSSNNDIAAINTTGLVTGVAAGTATISYCVADGSCATTIVTVNAAPSAGTITGTASVCVGSTSTLGNTVSGGSWNSNNGEIATVDVSGIVTGNAAGTATISYTVAGECGTNTTTQIVTVNAAPSAGIITGTANVCISSTTTLVSTTSGGSWSSNNGEIATVDVSGIVTGNAAGTVTISYTVSGECGASTTTQIVTVNAAPSAGTITGTANVCIGSTTTLSNTTTGGSWTSNNISVASVGTTGIVTGNAAGTATISYTVSGECGANTTTKIVTVNTAPSAGTITGTANVCVGSTTTLSNTTTGGSWSSNNTSVASVSTAGLVTGNAAGTATISYTVTGTCGSNTTNRIVTVVATPSAGTITGTATLCTGSNTTLSNTTTGGSWTSNNTSVASISSTGIVTGNAAGNAAISYTVTGECGTNTTTRIVTVNAAPTGAAISGASVVSAGSSVTLSGTPAGGTWSSSATAVATVNTSGSVSGIIAGTATISYTVTNTCGSNSATRIITVNAVVGAAISGSLAVCDGKTTTLSIATLGGTWSSTNTAVATINASGLVTGVDAGTTTISYITPTSFSTAVVTVNPLPTAISGPAFVCVNAAISFSSEEGGAWNSSNPASASVDASGIVSGLAAGTPIITYTSVNGCITSKAVSVHAIPAVPTGPASVCVGASITLTNAAAGTWSSANEDVAIVPTTPGVVSGVSAGTVIISFRAMATGCYSSRIITVNAAPAAITGSNVVCIGTLATYNSATPGGTWAKTSIPTSALAINTTTGSAIGSAAGTATITYFVSGCSTTRNVTVSASPGTINGTATLCTGSTTTLTATVAGGSWSSSNDAVASITAGVVTGITAGTATISYTNVAGCSTVKVVTVTAPPSATTTGSVCAGGNTTLTASVSGTWSGGTAGIATITSAGLVSGITAGTTHITFSSNASCFSTGIFTVNASIPPISGPGVVCAGSEIILNHATAGGSWSSSAPSMGSIAPDGTVRGISAGSTTITYSLAAGCRATVTITVSNPPNAIGGVASVCEGANTTLTNITTGGGEWSNDGANAMVGTSGIVTGIAAGTSVITFRSNLSGCATTRVVTVNATPSPIGGPSSVCVGSPATLTATPAGGTWTSTNMTLAPIGMVSGSFVAGGSGGVVSISYSLPTGCVTTTSLNVMALPVALTGGTTPFCAGTNINITAINSGLIWSSSNTSVATVSTLTALVGQVTGLVPGTATISYTNAAGCARTVVVTVTAAPNAIVGVDEICIAGTSTMTNATLGGTWSSSAPTTASIGISTGVLTGGSLGTATITYRTSATCYVTKIVTVVGTPSGTITGSAGVCIGSDVTFIHSAGGGTWSISNSVFATINASTGNLSGISQGNVTLTYHSAPGCFLTTPVTVYPYVFPISGTYSVCVGATALMDVAQAGGAWSVSAPIGTFSYVSASATNFTGVTAGTATVTYTYPTTGCYSMRVVTVHPLPATITGPSDLCVGTNITLATTTTGGTWLSGGGIYATVDATSGVVTGVAAGTVNISYRNALGCVNRKNITVNPLPAVFGGLPNLGTVTNTTATLTSSPAGGLWTSSNIGVATIGAASGVASSVSVGTTTITYTLPTTGCFRTRVQTVVAGRPMAGFATGTDAAGTTRIFPTPTTGMLTVEAAVSGNFRVMTMDGRTVAQYPISAASTTVNLPADLAAGIYMCQFEGVDGIAETLKVVLTK